VSPQQKVTVDVEGRQLALTNLDKPLYPDGFVKGQVIDYYSRIAPVLLPHLAGRPLTMKRYPSGVDGPFFFNKNAPSHTPDWVRTVTLPVPGSTMKRETIDFVVVEELATLVWVANLAGLELHTPQWRVGPRGAVKDPDLLVLDLDPGPPATVVECCRVAVRLRDRLAAEGVEVFAKTSGNKGMQLAARAPVRDTSAYAKELAEALEGDAPDLVLSRMTKALRGGKVFVDWSQNSAAKTTVSVYSMRARERPTVSTPVTWEEVEGCTRASDLVFTTDDVLARVEELGDLWSDLR
jgi:bifunctional non-homologous end joining protein LigD